jgi:hypothetical protein
LVSAVYAQPEELQWCRNSRDFQPYEMTRDQSIAWRIMAVPPPLVT